ncbi:MAG TPA: hypothetical protein DEV72_06265 [Ktedonobacter sp.]|nr:hypothetical protein [Ktedonobacter sp.]
MLNESVPLEEGKCKALHMRYGIASERVYMVQYAEVTAKKIASVRLHEAERALSLDGKALTSITSASRARQKPWKEAETPMIRIDIPTRGSIELHHAVFDINGTLAVDGMPIPEVVNRLSSLGAHLSLHALTAGTHGNIAELEHLLGLPLHIIGNGEEKKHYVERLGPTSVIAFGNGMNDVGMLRLAAIGVAVLAGEGVAIGALQAADVLALGPVDAIDLVLNPKRLVATLRG